MITHHYGNKPEDVQDKIDLSDLIDNGATVHISNGRSLKAVSCVLPSIFTLPEIPEIAIDESIKVWTSRLTDFVKAWSDHEIQTGFDRLVFLSRFFKNMVDFYDLTGTATGHLIVVKNPGDARVTDPKKLSYEITPCEVFRLTVLPSNMITDLFGVLGGQEGTVHKYQGENPFSLLLKYFWSPGLIRVAHEMVHFLDTDPERFLSKTIFKTKQDLFNKIFHQAGRIASGPTANDWVDGLLDDKESKDYIKSVKDGYRVDLRVFDKLEKSPKYGKNAIPMPNGIRSKRLNFNAGIE